MSDLLTPIQAFNKVWDEVIASGKKQDGDKWIRPEMRCVSPITCEVDPSGDKHIMTRYTDVVASNSGELTYSVGSEATLLLLARVI